MSAVFVPAVRSVRPPSLAACAGVAALCVLASCGGGGGGGGADASSDAAGAASGKQPAAAVECEPPVEATFEVELPLLTGQLPYPSGWNTDAAWPASANPSGAAPVSETITIPNGRPIYALIVSGYETNRAMDDLLVYDFATYLMSKGAYVHYAWWNNLLAPYMERPLHHDDSYPGDLAHDLFKFAGLTAPSGGVQRKAYPAEDFQFVADAKRLLTAIRAHNPSAMIVLVGHSMGGGAVIHLARETEVTLDLLAPIDPVNNRNYPWGGNVTDQSQSYYNWTRWRVTRSNFLGFKSMSYHLFQGSIPDEQWVGPGCYPEGDFLPSIDETDACLGLVAVHAPGVAALPKRIINLYHTWQSEAKFPFDYDDAYTFDYAPPPGGTEFQAEVQGILSDPLFGTQSDPGGWPYDINDADYLKQCCPSGGGIAWDDDGHGEIVGFRGPVSGDVQSIFFTIAPVPLGVRVVTSPGCGTCPGAAWPARTQHEVGALLAWDDGASNQALRAEIMRGLEAGCAGTPGFADTWLHRPFNPDLCLVSDHLASLFEIMNRPPVADAGDDQTLECEGGGTSDVVLDGSGSSDPDAGDALSYTWTGPFGTETGATVVVSVPLGTHCITLEVRDPSGHVDRDIVTVTAADTTPPDLSVSLSPTLLWPPNHKLVDVEAVVQASDGCGEVTELTLVSITSSDPDDGNGDGHTTGDVSGAALGTLDTSYQLRAEWSAPGKPRVYTVTYQATDTSGNRREVAVEVVVEPPGP